MSSTKLSLVVKATLFVIFCSGTHGSPISSGEFEVPDMVEFNLRNISTVDRCVIPGVVALTFDDGPFFQTYKVLNVLRENNVTATFFINGGNYMDIRWPNASAITQRTIDEGHIIASHTHNHPNLTDNRSREFIEFQMNHLSDEMLRLFGKRPWAMRPPFGEYNDTVVDIIGGELGYEIIMWTFSTADWAHPCNTTASLRRYIKNMNGTDPNTTLGFIVLHHDPIPCSDSLAAAVIEYVYSVGYRFVSLAECLGLPTV